MRQALRDHGYVEGRTIAIEWRYVGGDTARLPTLAAELAQLELAAIIAIGRARSYDGLGSPAKPSAARRSWPRGSSTLLLRK
jgi:hypothetical protein